MKILTKKNLVLFSIGIVLCVCFFLAYANYSTNTPHEWKASNEDKEAIVEFSAKNRDVLYKKGERGELFKQVIDKITSTQQGGIDFTQTEILLYLGPPNYIIEIDDDNTQSKILCTYFYTLLSGY